MGLKRLHTHHRSGPLLRPLLLLMLLCLSMGAYAQSSNPDSIAITGNLNWQLIKTTAQVKVWAKESDCNDAANGFFTKEVWLKMENLTGSALTVSWDKRLYYDNVCYRCNSTDGESSGSLTLAPYQTETGGCGSKSSIFIKMASGGGQALTSFELKNFAVN